MAGKAAHGWQEIAASPSSPTIRKRGSTPRRWMQLVSGGHALTARCCIMTLTTIPSPGHISWTLHQARRGWRRATRRSWTEPYRITMGGSTQSSSIGFTLDGRSLSRHHQRPACARRADALRGARRGRTRRLRPYASGHPIRPPQDWGLGGHLTPVRSCRAGSGGGRSSPVARRSRARGSPRPPPHGTVPNRSVHIHVPSPLSVAVPRTAGSGAVFGLTCHLPGGFLPNAGV